MCKLDLFQAIRLGDSEAFFNAISEGDLNRLNEYGQNALHESVAFDRTSFGQELIRLGINLDQQDHNGQTPLHFAAAHKNLGLATVIVSAGGNFSISDHHGNQPLWTAIFNARGQWDVVALLCDLGADANHKNKHNRSPLDFAKQVKNEVLVQMLSR